MGSVTLNRRPVNCGVVFTFRKLFSCLGLVTAFSLEQAKLCTRSKVRFTIFSGEALSSDIRRATFELVTSASGVDVVISLRLSVVGCVTFVL